MSEWSYRGGSRIDRSYVWCNTLGVGMARSRECRPARWYRLEGTGNRAVRLGNLLNNKRGKLTKPLTIQRPTSEGWSVSREGSRHGKISGKYMVKIRMNSTRCNVGDNFRDVFTPSGVQRVESQQGLKRSRVSTLCPYEKIPWCILPWYNGTCIFTMVYMALVLLPWCNHGKFPIPW